MKGMQDSQLPCRLSIETMSCVIYVLRIFILFAVTSASLTDTTDENCVEFVSDIAQYYQSSCIFILHEDTNDMEKLTDLMRLSRAFSKRRIPTTTIKFSRLMGHESLVKICPVRPTFLVLLDFRVFVNKFIKHTTAVDVKRPVWIVPSRVESYDKYHETMTSLIFNIDVILMDFARDVVYKWYGKEDRMVVAELGTWGPGKGLVINAKENTIQARADLHGRTLRVTAAPKDNLVQFVDGKMTGLYGDLIMELSIAMNFKIECTLTNLYGSRNKVFGNWSDMMSLISTNAVDLGVNGILVTVDRFRDVDFTLPLYDPFNKLYIERPDNSVAYFDLHQVFTQNILITAGPFILLSPVLLVIIDMVREKGIFMDVIIEYYLQTLGIYCQQGTSRHLPIDLSSRLVYLSIFMSSIIIYAAYSAMLVSSLANSSEEFPFPTIDNFIRDGSYKLAVVKNGATYDMLAFANDSRSQKLFSMMTNKIPESFQEGFDQLCKERVAFYTYMEDFFLKQINCDIIHIKGESRSSIALALPKHSPYREFINYYLQKFRESGLLNRLVHKYTAKSKRIDVSRIEVHLHNVSSALFLITIGMAFAVVILFLEIIYFKYLKRRCELTRLSILKRLFRGIHGFEDPHVTISSTIDEYVANFSSERHESREGSKLRNYPFEYTP